MKHHRSWAGLDPAGPSRYAARDGESLEAPTNTSASPRLHAPSGDSRLPNRRAHATAAEAPASGHLGPRVPADSPGGRDAIRRARTGGKPRHVRTNGTLSRARLAGAAKHRLLPG